MKNRLVNKKVVSSIGIGIMAFVTATSPVLTVLAEDGEPVDIPAPESTMEQSSEPKASSEPQNVEVSNSIQEAQDAIDGTKEKLPATSNEEPLSSIRDSLKNSKNELEAVKGDVSELDRLNQAAKDAEENLKKATEAGDENEDILYENGIEATEKINNLTESIEQNNEAAEKIAEDIKNAQEIIYENSAAAQAAKNQAEEDVKVAEAELDSAQEANEEAQKRLEDAEIAKDYFEERKDKADKALEDAKNAVAAAQDRLIEISEEYGFGNLDDFEAENAEGAAGKAYKAALKALEKAEADLQEKEQKAEEAKKALLAAEANKNDADKNLEAAQKELEAAANCYDAACDELEKAETALSDAEDAEKSAQETYENAWKNYKEGGTAEALEEAKKDSAEKAEKAEEAETLVKKAEEDLKEAEKAFKEVEGFGEVLQAGREIQNTAGAEKDKLDALAIKFIEYIMIKDGRTDAEIQGSWNNFENEDQNYLKVTFTDQAGLKVTAYYDYIYNSSTGNIALCRKGLPKNEGDNLVFPDKGEEIFTEEQFNTAVSDYETRKDRVDETKKIKEDKRKEADDAIEAAEDAKIAEDNARKNDAEAQKELKKSYDNLIEAQGKVSEREKEKEEKENAKIASGRDWLANAAKTESMQKAVNDMLDALKNAQAEVDAMNNKSAAATARKVVVQTAYDRVKEAIEDLSGLTSQKAVDTQAYIALLDKCEEAKKAYESAAKAYGVTEESLAKVEDAVKRAKEAAEGNFAYRTPTAPTTGGGTGGTTTGGGTGGTGGGTGTPTAPEAAPIVILPTAAVPLAGPGAADGAMLADADEEEEADLTTLEDEVTPLAGPESKAETVNLEDFPTPFAGPVAEMGQMSWWWLLIIAVLGVTGEEMYRRYQKKQREQANIEN